MNIADHSELRITKQLQLQQKVLRFQIANCEPPACYRSLWALRARKMPAAGQGVRKSQSGNRKFWCRFRREPKMGEEISQRFLGGAECTKIAQRHLLAIFTCWRFSPQIAGNSAMGISFVPLNYRDNRRSLVILDRTEIEHLGAPTKNSRFCGGAVEIAAAPAGIHAILVHSGGGASLNRNPSAASNTAASSGR